MRLPGLRSGRKVMAAWNPRANEVFASVVELPPPERLAYLDAACGGDAGLRAEVEALVAAHDRAGDFLDSPIPVGERDIPTVGPGVSTPLPDAPSVVRTVFTPGLAVAPSPIGLP